jgi:hypothetical protein
MIIVQYFHLFLYGVKRSSGGLGHGHGQSEDLASPFNASAFAR